MAAARAAAAANGNRDAQSLCLRTCGTGAADAREWGWIGDEAQPNEGSQDSMLEV